MQQIKLKLKGFETSRKNIYKQWISKKHHQGFKNTEVETSRDLKNLPKVLGVLELPVK